MPKWSKNAKEFEVNIHYNDDKGSQVRVPKPILEKLDNPEKLKFVVDGKNIRVIPVDKSKPVKSIDWKEKRKLT